MNKVILCGNLTKDPEIKQVKDYSICTFSLAVNDIKDTQFFNCEAWGTTAVTVANYVKKGQKLLVEGRIKIEKSEKTSYTKIVIERIELIHPKNS